MYLIREVFQTKPGRAKNLVDVFKQAAPLMEEQHGIRNMKVMTDIVTTYWTVVIEYEVESLGDFVEQLRGTTSSPELESIFDGYMEYVEGGRREVYLLE